MNRDVIWGMLLGAIAVLLLVAAALYLAVESAAL